MNIQDTKALNLALAQYNSLLEEAQMRGVSSDKVKDSLVEAILAGKDFSSAVSQVRSELPELPSPSSFTPPSSKDWVALPSPAAMLAGVIIQDAAEQRRTNRSIIQSQGTQIANLMEEQADKMEKGAMQKFACAVAGAVVNMTAGATSLGLSVAGVGRNSETGKLTFGKSGTVAHGGADGQLTAAFSQSLSSTISSMGSIITAGGEYAESLQNADAKRIAADEERIRTMMEQTKQTNEAMRDLVSKSLDFMNAMQQNMNQTRTKILG